MEQWMVQNTITHQLSILSSKHFLVIDDEYRIIMVMPSRQICQLMNNNNNTLTK